MLARPIALLACVVLAVATPAAENAKRWAPPPTTTTTTVTVTASPTATAGSCGSAGPVQCCSQTALADSPEGIIALAAAAVEDLATIVVDGINVVLGIQCSPVVGASCEANTVCCQNNNFGGWVSIGCAPVIL